MSASSPDDETTKAAAADTAESRAERKKRKHAAKKVAAAAAQATPAAAAAPAPAPVGAKVTADKDLSRPSKKPKLSDGKAPAGPTQTSLDAQVVVTKPAGGAEEEDDEDDDDDDDDEPVAEHFLQSKNGQVFGTRIDGKPAAMVGDEVFDSPHGMFSVTNFVQMLKGVSDEEGFKAGAILFKDLKAEHAELYDEFGTFADSLSKEENLSLNFYLYSPRTGLPVAFRSSMLHWKEKKNGYFLVDDYGVSRPILLVPTRLKASQAKETRYSADGKVEEAGSAFELFIADRGFVCQVQNPEQNPELTIGLGSAGNKPFYDRLATKSKQVAQEHNVLVNTRMITTNPVRGSGGDLPAYCHRSVGSELNVTRAGNLESLLFLWLSCRGFLRHADLDRGQPEGSPHPVAAFQRIMDRSRATLKAMQEQVGGKKKKKKITHAMLRKQLEKDIIQLYCARLEVGWKQTDEDMLRGGPMGLAYENKTTGAVLYTAGIRADVPFWKEVARMNGIRPSCPILHQDDSKRLTPELMQKMWERGYLFQPFHIMVVDDDGNLVKLNADQRRFLNGRTAFRLPMKFSVTFPKSDISTRMTAKGAIVTDMPVSMSSAPLDVQAEQDLMTAGFKVSTTQLRITDLNERVSEMEKLAKEKPPQIAYGSAQPVPGTHLAIQSSAASSASAAAFDAAASGQKTFTSYQPGQ